MRMFAVDLLTVEDIIVQIINKYSHEPWTSSDLINMFSPWNKMKQILIHYNVKKLS